MGKRIPITAPPTVILQPPAIIRRDTSRAEEVVQQLLSMEGAKVRNEYALFDLWAEFIDGDYFAADHCQTAEEFLKKHGLDVSPREVAYRTNISRKSKALELTHEQLIKAKISKVKTVMTLDPGVEYISTAKGYEEKVSGADIMRDLIQSAINGRKLSDIKNEVAQLVGKKDNKPAPITIFPADDDRKLIDHAVELVRKNAGTTVDEAGVEQERSLEFCFTLLSVSYLQDPNNNGEEVGEEGSFKDESFVQGEDGTLYEEAQ